MIEAFNRSMAQRWSGKTPTVSRRASANRQNFADVSRRLRQAEQYAQLFGIFRKHQDVIARISFWNLHDGQSWLNSFPWNRANHPLLFDREGRPKPAYNSVIKALAP